MTERDRTPGQQQERERIEEHFARGRALGETLTAAADHPAQVYRLALNALDTAELPVVQADPGQVALLMGIVSACAEWITADEPAQSDPANDADLADRARELAHRLAAGAGAIVAEVNPNWAGALATRHCALSGGKVYGGGYALPKPPTTHPQSYCGPAAICSPHTDCQHGNRRGLATTARPHPGAWRGSARGVPRRCCPCRSRRMGMAVAPA